jgi:hypothetical protein
MFRHLLAGSAVPIKDREYGKALPALPANGAVRAKTPVSARALLNRRESFVAATAARSPFMRLADLVDETTTEAARDPGGRVGGGGGNEDVSAGALPSLAHLKATGAAAAAAADKIGVGLVGPAGLLLSAGSDDEARVSPLATLSASSPLLFQTGGSLNNSTAWWAEDAGTFGTSSSSMDHTPPPRLGQLRRPANDKVPAGKVGLGLWSSHHWGSSRDLDRASRFDRSFDSDAASLGTLPPAARGQRRAPARDAWDVSAPTPWSAHGGGPPAPPESQRQVATRCRRWLIRKGVVPHQMGPASRLPATWSPALLKVVLFLVSVQRVGEAGRRGGELRLAPNGMGEPPACWFHSRT